MIGAVFRGPGHLEVGEVKTPEIEPDEILVKVGANTLCGTDVRILCGEKTHGIGRDVVLGHEVAGHVAEIGSNVRGYEVGVPVVLAPALACHHCFYCKRGMENVCLNKRIVGNILDGGLAEYVRIPADAVAAGNLSVARKDLRLIESGRVAAERMITRLFPLADAEKAIETSADGEGVKVAVMP